MSEEVYQTAEIRKMAMEDDMVIEMVKASKHRRVNLETSEIVTDRKTGTMYVVSADQKAAWRKRLEQILMVEGAMAAVLLLILGGLMMAAGAWQIGLILIEMVLLPVAGCLCWRENRKDYGQEKAWRNER